MLKGNNNLTYFTRCFWYANKLVASRYFLQKTTGKTERNTKQYKNRFEESETYPGSKELRGQAEK